ncbi:MAG: hypothetical protein KW793_01730 [Candidatus Doudnabacteria bacterium]|nr:hypothetical protein [Candidatus Doudnabacteria bacterium]
MFEETFGFTWQVAQTILVNYYGWVLFAGVFIWIGYRLWLERQIIKYLSTIKWVYLEARVDQLNERSPVAMEQVFTSMHAMMQFFSMGEKWSGRIPLWMSAEIVSIGGRVSYMFKLPERYRNLLESAVFAQYPKAEIREIQDYLGNLPRNWDLDTEFDLWGTQFIKRAFTGFPIRTYRQDDQFFEHPEQKTTIDALSGVIEAMSNIMPHELMAIQIVIKPTGDDWKPGAYEQVAKMKGIPPKAKPADWFEKIFLNLPGAALEAILTGIGMAGEPIEKKEEKVQPLTQTMTDAEKMVIDSVVAGLGKLSFEVKMRLMYLAPKDKFSKGMRVPEILGTLKNFDNPQLNGLRPDIKITTDASFKLFQSLEQPYLDHKIKTRKNKFLRWFKDRAHWEGSGWTIMNTEELATLFHFPQAPNARVSQVEKVQTVKSAPPIDLPIG